MSASFPQSNFIQGGFYHIYNRGIRKQDIFIEKKDYQRYLDRMIEYKDRHHVSILAYCLMPNHVHLLIRQNGPEPASQFIQRLHTAYTMYFNKKYNLVGHPFQSRFKAKIITKDEYLMHLSRYIHLNPQKLVSKLPAYKWSSYPDYIKGNSDRGLVETKFVLSMFKRKNQQMEDAIRQYIEFTRAQQQSQTLEKVLFPEDTH